MIDLNAITPEFVIVVSIISNSVSQGVSGISSMVLVSIIAAPLTKEPASYQLLSYEWWFSRLPEESLN